RTRKVRVVEVRVVAILQAVVQREARMDLPRIVEVRLDAVVDRRTTRIVEGQDVVADAHRDVADRRVEEVLFGGEGGAGEGRAVEADTRRLGERELAAD